MSKNHVELSDIIPFKEDERWYLKLIYKYENEEGKHTVIIQKAAIPFHLSIDQYPITHVRSDNLI